MFTVSISRKHHREAALELGGKNSLEQMIQNQDTRFEAVEKEVRRVFNTQVKLQTTMREMEARLDAETQNLSEIKRKDQQPALMTDSIFGLGFNERGMYLIQPRYMLTE